MNLRRDVFPQHQVQDFVDAERQQLEGRQVDDQRGGINQPGAEKRPGVVSGPTAVEAEQANQLRRLAEDEGDSRRPREEEEEDSWGWGRDRRRFGPAWLAVATFVHEVWLLLQHANILLNPCCQRLDRSYGVALVRKQIKVVAPSLVLVSLGFRLLRR